MRGGLGVLYRCVLAGYALGRRAVAPRNFDSWTASIVKFGNSSWKRTKSAIVKMKCGEMGLIDAMLRGCINILAIDIDIPFSQVQYTLEHIALVIGVLDSKAKIPINRHSTRFFHSSYLIYNFCPVEGL
jgi:hypothetical protein